MLNIISKYFLINISVSFSFWAGPKGFAKKDSTNPFSVVVPFAILAPALNTFIASSGVSKYSKDFPSSTFE